MDERPAETSAEHLALANSEVASNPTSVSRAALHIGAAIALSLQEAVDQLHEIQKTLAQDVEPPSRPPVDPDGPRPPSVGEVGES